MPQGQYVCTREQQLLDQRLLRTVQMVCRKIKLPKCQFWELVADLMETSVDEVVTRYNRLLHQRRRRKYELVERMLEEDGLRIDGVDIGLEDVMQVNLTDNVTSERIYVLTKTILKIPYLCRLLQAQLTTRHSHFNIQCDIAAFKLLVHVIESEYSADTAPRAPAQQVAAVFLLARHLQATQVTRMYLEMLVQDPDLQLHVTLSDGELAWLLERHSPFHFAGNERVFGQLTNYLIARYQRTDCVRCTRCGHITQRRYVGEPAGGTACAHSYGVENDAASGLSRMFGRRPTSAQLLLAMLALVLRVGYECDGTRHEGLLQDVLPGAEAAGAFTPGVLASVRLDQVTEQLYTRLLPGDVAAALGRPGAFEAAFVQRLSRAARRPRSPAACRTQSPLPPPRTASPVRRVQASRQPQCQEAAGAPALPPARVAMLLVERRLFRTRGPATPPPQ